MPQGGGTLAYPFDAEKLEYNFQKTPEGFISKDYKKFLCLKPKTFV